MRILSIAFLFFVSAQASVAQTALEKDLFLLCGVVFEEIPTAEGFEASYKLMVKQPIDHKNPQLGHFFQKVYLNHRSADAPVVFVTEGYNRNSNRIYELTDFLEANQVTVEHRCFGESMPDSLDYNYLTFEQAAHDLHAVNLLMKEIYTTPLIATGISKGGTTTIFYRYFYPEDVAVSVPYVAPLNYELEEKRIYHFLDTVGSESCRKSILDFQIRLLKNRDYNLDRLKWYSIGRNLEFTYLSMEEAFEYAVLEYPFSLWQWGTPCDSVPGPKSDPSADLNHLLEVSGPDFFADESMQAYGSHYFQSGTEMGYYGYEIKPFKKHIKALSTESNPSAVFMPGKMEAKWDATLTNKVAKWIEKEGNRFIYINGLNDTWSATRVPVSKNVDAVWFNMAGQSHGTARIANMTEDEKKHLKDAINRWIK